MKKYGLWAFLQVLNIGQEITDADFFPDSLNKQVFTREAQPHGKKGNNGTGKAAAFPHI